MYGAHVRMVIEIAHQKNAGRCKRGNHASPMQFDQLARDQHAARCDEERTGTVQCGIQGGEEAVVRHGISFGFTLPAACACGWRQRTPLRTPRRQKAPARRSKATTATWWEEQ